MDISGYPRTQDTLVWILLLPLCAYTQVLEEGPVKKVSQCYQPGGFSFVSLYCGHGHVIQIQRAFHGRHRNPSLAHCGLLDSDCTDDTTHTYDWTKCEGRHSCVQVIQPRALTAGAGAGAGAGCGRSSKLYLQVHYTCVQGSMVTTTTTALPPRRTVDVMKPTSAEELHTICTNYTSASERSLSVVSPGYPYYYPSNTECRCLVKAQPNSKVTVTYQDLGLLMRANQCVDWLLLQSLGFKNSAAVTCGQMTAGQEKTLTAKGNWLLLHFHTAKAKDTRTQRESEMNAGQDLQGKVMKKMKGFKVKVTSEPAGVMQVQCYRASSAVLASLQYRNSQHDASDNILLPQSDLNAIAKPSTAESVAARLAPDRLTQLATCLLPLISLITTHLHQLSSHHH